MAGYNTTGLHNYEYIKNKVVASLVFNLQEKRITIELATYQKLDHFWQASSL